MPNTPVPINVVGSSKFGIYPKISLEKTLNMYVSDDWLINYYGYKLAQMYSTVGSGRGIYYSTRLRIFVFIAGTAVFIVNEGLGATQVGNIGNATDGISIAENLAGQIAICDQNDIYIIDTTNAFTLTKQVWGGVGVPAATVIPGYVFYHNTYFIVTSTPGSTNSSSWYIFKPNTGDNTLIELVDSGADEGIKAIQTKPDVCIAGARIPGGGNNILLLGSTVGEMWTQIGDVTFYRRVQSWNLDFGIASIETLATDEKYLMFLAKNSSNKYFIVLMEGNSWKAVGTDGIDHLIENLKAPETSSAFFYRQDGHLFYQITFFDSRDNISLFYDVKVDAFYDTCDEKYDYHPARQCISFDNKAYFISLNDAGLYEMNSEYTTYNYNLPDNNDEENGNADDTGFIIPRIRTMKAVRKTNYSIYTAIRFRFWLEQGITDFSTLAANTEICDGALITEDGVDFIITEDGDTLLGEGGFCYPNLERPAVDLSFSKNGGQSFSNIVRNYMNTQGNHRNQMTWNELGFCNEIVLRLRFISLNRFVCGPGELEISE